MYYATRSSEATGAAVALSEANLAEHSAPIRLPGYDRSSLVPSIVHIGVGGFHRAHQATYFDDLAASGASMEWGLTGVSLRNRAMKEALAPQDGLFTVVERGPGAAAPRIVGSLAHCLFAREEPAAVLAALSDPQTRLVTLTVTGDGYAVDRTTGAFCPDDPGVVADLANPTRPRTAIGYLVEALDRRRRAGLPGFTVLSCDNLPSNGRVARAAVVSFAACRDESLAAWIDANVAFPSSVVDRITPQTETGLRRLLAREFGVADRWPVATEPFSQWVIEDSFSAGRPPLDEVGVEFVSDTAPHELVKKRMLNGGHCALGYIGTLRGHERADEAMGDPLLRSYMVALMTDEIAPQLPVVPGLDIAAYGRTVRERFANPEIADRLARLCARGSTKMPAYLLPSLSEAVEAGRPHRLLMLALAAWVRHLQGGDGVDGTPHHVEDALAAELRPLALEATRNAAPLLAKREVFGDLGGRPGVAESLEAALRKIETQGIGSALQAVLSARSASPQTC